MNNPKQPELSSLTWEQFFDFYKPECLIERYWNINSIEQSITTYQMTFAEMRDKFGDIKHKKYGNCEFGALYYHEWLSYLNEISNTSKPLPVKFIGDIARWLYVKYCYFCISDLKLLLEGILEGKYGQFFGSIDSQLILRAFKEYDEKRRRAIYDYYEKTGTLL